MTLSSLSLALLAVACIGLAACSGTANSTVPNANLGSNGSVQDAFIAGETSAQLRALGSDLQAYRAESDPTDATIWVVSYWSLSQNKSWRCRFSSKFKQLVDITETIDPAQIHHAHYQIDWTQVKVTPEVAAAAAVTSINTTNNTSSSTTVVKSITLDNITSVQVISPQECMDRTGHAPTSPVYVVITSNNKAYVNASNGQAITTTTNATPAPTGSPLAAPSATVFGTAPR